MTIQRGENLSFNNEFRFTLSGRVEPLKPLIDSKKILIPGSNNISSLWRGYIGQWDITDQALVLLNAVNIENQSILPLLSLDAGIHASWYTGNLRFEAGEVFEFCPIAGQRLRFEVEISITQGLVSHFQVKDRADNSSHLSSESVPIFLMELLSSRVE